MSKPKVCVSSDRSVTVKNLIHCDVDDDGGGLFIIFSRLILPTTNYTTTKCSVMEKQKQQPLEKCCVALTLAL
jgi:hypothetical protein